MSARGAQPEMQNLLLPTQPHAGPHPALVPLQGVSSQGRGLGTAAAGAHPPPRGDPAGRSLWIPAPFPPSRMETFAKHLWAAPAPRAPDSPAGRYPGPAAPAQPPRRRQVPAAPLAAPVDLPPFQPSVGFTLGAERGPADKPCAPAAVMAVLEQQAGPCSAPEGDLGCWGGGGSEHPPAAMGMCFPRPPASPEPLRARPPSPRGRLL